MLFTLTLKIHYFKKCLLVLWVFDIVIYEPNSSRIWNSAEFHLTPKTTGTVTQFLTTEKPNHAAEIRVCCLFLQSDRIIKTQMSQVVIHNLKGFFCGLQPPVKTYKQAVWEHSNTKWVSSQLKCKEYWHTGCSASLKRFGKHTPWGSVLPAYKVALNNSSTWMTLHKGNGWEKQQA